MSDPVNRKACDRCHQQKLSCKRTNEATCERCRRIQVNCTWSPSLRYIKSQKQQSQQKNSPKGQKKSHSRTQQREERHEARDNRPTAPTERRSPKRRRTGSDPDLVSPEAVSIIPQPGSTADTTASKPIITEGTPVPTVLDIRDFDFNLTPVEFYEGAQQQQQQQQHLNAHQQHQQLSQVAVQAGIDQFHHQHSRHTPPQYFHNWDHTLGQPHNGYIDLSTASLPGSGAHHQDSAEINVNSVAQRTRGPLTASGSTGSGSLGLPRRRGRRLISLRASCDARQEIHAPSHTASDLDTPLHWMARLSEINTRLQALASLLPAQYDATDGGVRNQSFPVDEMFQLTRQVADVLDHLCGSAEDSQRPGSKELAKVDGSDPGSAMFVLSVYVMLLDLYHKAFALVRSEVFQKASAATFAFWKLPDVTIGSFAVESSPSLQMSLTIQLAEEFLSRLRRSTDALDPSRNLPSQNGSGEGNQSIFTGVVDASFHEIRSSEDSLRQELGALRDRIEELLEGR